MRSIVSYLVVLVVALGGGQEVLSDDSPATWDALLKEKEVTQARLAELQQQFPLAPAEEKVKIRDEFRGLVERYQEQIMPQLEKLLTERLQQGADEQAKEVAAEVIQFDFQQNQYPKVNQLCELLLKQDPDNVVAANFGGVAKFALHDFAQAAAVLEKAAQQGTLVPDLGGNYLEASKSYVEYWKKEQEIRTREAAASPDQKLPRVRLRTSKGDIVLELFENEAPNTVANFINLVESKFYDGTKFHRVIPGFMAQGGSPLSRNGNPRDPRVGGGGPGYTIKCECYRPDARRHFAGSISMAHAGKDTGGSQFFITHLPTPHLDKEVAPEYVHTVFGRVAEGMDVVYALDIGDEIVSATVLNKRNHPYKPETTPEG